MAICNDMKNQPKSKTGNCSKDALKAVRREMATFEEDGTRGSYLREAYEYLKTVKPSSVESERAFSASGNFVTKLRSSLEDKTLNALCFLRAHFQKEHQKKNN